MDEYINKTKLIEDIRLRFCKDWNRVVETCVAGIVKYQVHFEKLMVPQ